MWRGPLTIVAGAVAGGLCALLFPAAATLAASMRDAGVGAQASWAIVLGLFVTGGAEGALFLCPLIRAWRDHRGST